MKISLRFFATLPTLKLKETTYKNIILWEVKLEKPITILHIAFPTVDSFFIRIDTSTSEISIKKNKYDKSWYLIEPHEEEWYIKNKWWRWSK